MTNLRWQERAACKVVPIDKRDRYFFPGSQGTPAVERAYTYAKETYCENCPVREDCLAYAIDNGERFGLWGGMSPQERRILTHGEIDHGTVEGYRQHRLAGGAPCTICTIAWSAYCRKHNPDVRRREYQQRARVKHHSDKKAS